MISKFQKHNTLFSNMLSLILLSIITSITAIWTLPFLVFQVFGLSLFQIKDKKEIDKILKKINNSTLSTLFKYEYGELQKSGFLISFYCIGYLQDQADREKEETKQTLYILISPKLLDQYLSENKTVEGKIELVNNSVELYEREGNYFHLYYGRRTIEFDLTCTLTQHFVVNNILDYYNKHDYCVAFIHGFPGAGKTTIAYFIATLLKGSLCKSFKPYEPGDTLNKLIDRSAPTQNKPLIILFDEINIMIKKIHNQTIERHKHIPIQVYDKTTFNTFLDDMKYNKHIILLLTSNETKEQIDCLDASYLRKGRVDVVSSV